MECLVNLEGAKEFLNQHETCVVATSGKDSQPEAATVGFSIDDDLKILIATNKKTRKAANLVENNKVALVVGFDGPKTVQLEGKVEKIDQTKYQDRINLHFEKVPGAKRFAGESGQNYYLITPTWLRFTDYTQKPPIFETENFS